MTRKRKSASNYERTRGGQARHAREKSEAKTASGGKPLPVEEKPPKERIDPWRRLMAKLDKDRAASTGNSPNEGAEE